MGSSAAAHINGYNDVSVTVKPLLDLVDDWQGLLDSSTSDEETKILQRHERTGRPLGSLKFVKRLEQRLGKTLIPQKGGRP